MAQPDPPVRAGLGQVRVPVFLDGVALGVVGMVILTASLLIAGKILGKKKGQLFRA